DPNDTFIGLAGQFVESHPRWGVTKTWYNTLLNQGVFEDDYIVGGNAGTLNIEINADVGVPNTGEPPLANSGGIVLDSTILAGDVAGSRQVESAQLPSGGNFIFSTFLPIEIAGSATLPGMPPGTQSGTSAGSSQGQGELGPPAGFTPDSPLLATPDSDYAKANVLDSQRLDNAGFSTLRLTAGNCTGFHPITEN